jgi:hypothetical protein
MSEHSLVEVRLRLFDERGMRFARLRNARVLIYWPHGFGDFAHLGYLLPLLEPSNQYWIARYGDDFSALYRKNRYAAMLPSGILSTENIFGNAARDFHLGARYGSASGKSVRLSLTATLAAGVREQGIDSVLWTDYPDSHGALRYPYHTKIRSLVRRLILPERLASFDLRGRLSHAIPFHEAEAEADSFVDHRLSERFGAISQLALVQSGGHTEPKKAWEAAEAHAFASRYVAVDPRRAVLLLSEPATRGGADGARIATWRELFAPVPPESGGLPYARVFRAVLARTAHMVGVPAGPTHLALATERIPTIALWRAHHPLAYEEPNPYALHVIGESVRRERSGQWKLARKVEAGFLGGAMMELPTASIPARIVHEAAERWFS